MTWAWAAVAVAIVDAMALTAALLASAAVGDRLGIAATGSWINLVAAPTFPLLAALMLRPRRHESSRPVHQDRLALLFLAFGVLCAATLVLHVAVLHGLRDQVPAAPAGAWLSSWLWTGVPTGFLLALLWFPTGDVPGARWRWAVRGVVVSYAAITVPVAFAPGPMTDFPGQHPNPLGWAPAGTVLHLVGTAGFVVLGTTAVATVASVVWRFWRGDASVRSQLRWLVVAVGVIAVTLALPAPKALDTVVLVLNVAATFLLPVTLAVALVRRDGPTLPRVLVYGLLSVLLLAGYIGVVGAAETVFGGRVDEAAALVAAGLVAVAAAPLRSRLQRSVDRLVYGARGDPYAALSDLGRRIAGSPDDLLHEVVHAVADALRAPHVAVVLAGDDAPTALAGTSPGPTLEVPLAVRGRPVGSLVVARRTPGEPYGGRDLALLHDLAGPVAVAAHAATLTRDLRRSREALVIAREEERRRIRRDLHDGLGPALAGVAFGIDAARNTLAADPIAAEVLLTELKAEIQASIADVRRLVYDLRPPTLDRLGLVPALKEYAGRLAERGALHVFVSAPPMPPLPAAVEVAAYRIATEALTNALRHSGARRTTVSLAVEGTQLRLEVADDGTGVADRSSDAPGVGIAAMAERAAELGGTCSVNQRAERGTSVVAMLPLAAAS